MSQGSFIITRPADKPPLPEDVIARLNPDRLTEYNLPLLALHPISEVKYNDKAKYSLIFFSSTYAVQVFHKYNFPLDDRTYLGAVGAQTAAFLHELYPQHPQHKIITSPAQSVPDSESFWQQFLLQANPQRGQMVLINKGVGGRTWLADKMRSIGLRVHECDLYKRVPIEWKVEQIHIFTNATTVKRVEWLLTSQEAVSALFAQLYHLQLLAKIHKHIFLVIHPRIAHQIQLEMLKYFPEQVMPLIKIVQL